MAGSCALPGPVPQGHPGQGVWETLTQRAQRGSKGSGRIQAFAPLSLPDTHGQPKPQEEQDGAAGGCGTVLWHGVSSRSRPYQSDPSFDPEFIKTKSTAAGGLCSWCLNIVRFYEVFCEVEPKRLALEEANAELAEAQEKLSRIKSKIAVSVSSPTPAAPGPGASRCLPWLAPAATPSATSHSAVGQGQEPKMSEKGSYNSRQQEPRCKSCVVTTGAAAKLLGVCGALSWPGSSLRLRWGRGGWGWGGWSLSVCCLLKELNANLAALTAEFEKATAEKIKCQQEADATTRVITLANRYRANAGPEALGSSAAPRHCLVTMTQGSWKHQRPPPYPPQIKKILRMNWARNLGVENAALEPCTRGEGSPSRGGLIPRAIGDGHPGASRPSCPHPAQHQEWWHRSSRHLF